MSLEDVIKMSNEDRRKQNRRPANRRGNNRNLFFRNKNRKGSDSNVNPQRSNLRGGNQRRFKQRVNKKLTINLLSLFLINSLQDRKESKEIPLLKKGSLRKLDLRMKKSHKLNSEIRRQFQERKQK